MKNAIPVLLLFLCFKATGQPNLTIPVSPANIEKARTVHSPDVASLGRYTLSAPAYSSGAAQKNIPLFTLEENGLHYPIELNYGFSGFKPRELASTAGLGWSISQGTIIRNVKGLPDGTAWRNFDDFNYDNLDPYDMVVISPGPGTSFLYNLTANRIYNKKIDNQPDEYIYNVGGYSGKFYWLDGVAVKFPHNDLEIKCPNYLPGNVLNYFIITTPDGIDYKLSPYDETYGQKHWNYETEGYESDYKPVTCGGYSTPNAMYEDNSYTTTWRVSRIEHKNTKSAITFEYDSYTEQVYSDGVATNSISFWTNNAPNIPFNTFYSSMTPLTDPHPSYLFKKNYNLKKIQSDNYVIDYKYVGSNSLMKLDSIIVSSSLNNTLVFKKIRLNHQGSYLLKELFIYGEGEEKKYQFNYYGVGVTPDITSNSIDHWGFFNGAQNSTLVPKTDLIIQAENSGAFINVNNYSSITWADREPDFESAKENALSEIIYPTGGKSTIEYESANGKGIRVKSVKDSDYFGAPEVKRYYSYFPNTAPPVPTYNSNQYNTDVMENCYYPSNNAPWTANAFLSVTASAMSSLSDFELSQNYYDYVVEYLGSPIGANGRNEYKFIKEPEGSEQVLPIEQISYNAAGGLVKKTQNTYDIQALRTIQFWTDPILLRPQLTKNCVISAGIQYCDSEDPTFYYALSKDENLAIQKGLIRSNWIKLSQTVETNYGTDNTSLSSTTTNSFKTVVSPNTPSYSWPFQVQQQFANGDNISVRTYYPGDTYVEGMTSIVLGPDQMWVKANANYKSLLSLPIRMVKNFNGVKKEQVNYTYSYDATNDEVNLSKSERFVNNENVATINLGYNKGDLLKEVDEDGRYNSFLMDYNQRFITAKVTNGRWAASAYTGFEGVYTNQGVVDKNKGNWDFDRSLISGTTAVTGERCLRIPGGNNSVITSDWTLATGVRYTLSFWASSTSHNVKNGSTTLPVPTATKTLNGGWQLFVYNIVGTGNTVTIKSNSSGNVEFDEIRLHNENASMKTYSHGPTGNITSICDERNTTTFYEYDIQGRLALVRNEYKHIIQKSDYRLQQ